MSDTIRFEIRWKSNKKAQLFYLMDGGLPVPLDPPHPTGTGKITVTYQAPATVAHRIQWGLAFPGKKLSGLVAEASVNGGKTRTLKKTKDDEEKEHKWTGTGTAY